jgi:hypothetical protein
MGDNLAEGDRVGRFIILRDVGGITHAVAVGSVAAMCETDEGVFMMLPGGRLIHIPQSMAVILEWLGRP